MIMMYDIANVGCDDVDELVVEGLNLKQKVDDATCR